MWTSNVMSGMKTSLSVFTILVGLSVVMPVVRAQVPSLTIESAATNFIASQANFDSNYITNPNALTIAVQTDDPLGCTLSIAASLNGGIGVLKPLDLQVKGLATAGNGTVSATFNDYTSLTTSPQSVWSSNGSTTLSPSGSKRVTLGLKINNLRSYTGGPGGFSNSIVFTVVPNAS